MTITVYNHWRNPQTHEEAWYPTMLSGLRTTGGTALHWEDTRVERYTASGIATGDAVTVLIWFSVAALGREYLPPKDYAALSAEQLSRYWTLTPGKDRIVKGIMGEPAPTYAPSTLGEPKITIAAVDTVDYGSPSMHHWEVMGK